MQETPPIRFTAQEPWQHAMANLTQLLEMRDMLHEYLLPHFSTLSLREVLSISKVSTGMHQLIADMPLGLLSAEACRTLVPSGLTSQLPLLECLRRQLVSKIKGKTPHEDQMQHVRNSAADPSLQIEKGSWGPQLSLEEPSSCILLSGIVTSPSSWNPRRQHLAAVVTTGQSVLLPERVPCPQALSNSARGVLDKQWARQQRAINADPSTLLEQLQIQCGCHQY